MLLINKLTFLFICFNKCKLITLKSSPQTNSVNTESYFSMCFKGKGKIKWDNCLFFQGWSQMLDDVAVVMADLTVLRGRLLKDTLSAEQATSLREEIATLVDWGNGWGLQGVWGGGGRWQGQGKAGRVCELKWNSCFLLYVPFSHKSKIVNAISIFFSKNFLIYYHIQLLHSEIIVSHLKIRQGVYCSSNSSRDLF